MSARPCLYGIVALSISCVAAGCESTEPRARQVAPSVSTDEQPAAQQAAQPVALAWFGLLDAGKYKESWSAASMPFRDHTSQSRWKATIATGRGYLGELVSRKFQSAVFAQTIPDYDYTPEGRWLAGRKGEYVIVKFSSSYFYVNVTETVIVMKDFDEVWRVADYSIASGDATSCTGSKICR